MIKHPEDIQIGGLLISPFVGYVLLALLLFVLVRWCSSWLRFEARVSNPTLAEAALYMIVLGLVITLV
jgi:hypothetical protein